MQAFLGNLHSADLWVFEHANRVWTAPWSDAFFVWLTSPPYRVILFTVLALALIILGGRRGRIAAVTIAVALLISDPLCNAVIKPWVGRVRPCFALPDTRLLLTHQPHSPSFPSSHAMNTFAVAAVLFEVAPWVGWVGIVVAALVGWSRMYVGVHYPSDVLAGALFGLAIGFGTVWVKRRILARAPSIWRRGPGAPPRPSSDS